MKENLKSKAERHVLWSFIAVILLFIFVPVVSGIGAQISAPFTNAEVPYSGVNTWSVYTSNGTSIPASSSAATFFFSAKSNEAIIVTNLTFQTALEYDLHKIVLTTSTNVNESIMFTIATGVSAKNYLPLAYENINLKAGTNLNSVTFNLAPYMYGASNSSDHVIFIVSNATYGSEFGLTARTYGTTSTSVALIFNPITIIDAGLLMLGTAMFALTYIGSIFIEQPKLAEYGKKAVRKGYHKMKNRKKERGKR